MLKYLIPLIALLVLLRVPAYAANQGCQSYSYEYDAGKTPVGFEATATDGCNRAEWTGSIAQGPGEGTVTIRTIGNIQPTEQGYTLPSMAGGAANYCRARAAQDANGYWTNHFKVPVGTEVTVTYRCT